MASFDCQHRYGFLFGYFDLSCLQSTTTPRLEIIETLCFCLIFLKCFGTPLSILHRILASILKGCPSDEIIERFQEQIDQIIESGKDDGTLFYLTEEKHSSPSWPAIKTVYLSKLHLVKLRFIKYSLLDRLDMLSSLKRVITTSTLPVFEDLEEKINKKTRVM
jgi:hypothetical protein